MKYEQRVLAFLLFLVLFIPRLSYSQDDTLTTNTTAIYKNSLKGMPLLLPFVGVAFYAGLSIGYERYISKHHGLELCGYYYFNTDEMGAQFHSIGIMPAYKFFSVSENERYNNFWISVYLNYYQHIQTISDEGNGWNTQYYYGIGVSVGKKINLSRNKRWFLDLGFGVSINKFLDESIFSDTKWEDKFISNSFLPRLALQIGRKF